MPRRPKPTAQKRLEGNPGKRPLPKHEPQLPVEAPACPAHLGAVARETWHRKVQEYLDAKVLAKVDGDALSGYCELYAVSVRLSEAINDPAWAPAVIEAVVDSDGGTQPRVKANPLIDAKLKVVRELRLHAIEFGSTPASRSKVQAKADDRDPIEALLESEPDVAIVTGKAH